MHNLLRPLSPPRSLRDPILIAGFADHTGTTAASTVAYLAAQWDAEPVAEIDPEELFDFTVRRPLVFQQEGERVLQWPTNQLYVASPAGAERDIVLLVGTEPHLKWRTFCSAIATFMQEVGALTSITLSAHPGSTPHTRPAPLRLATADEEFGRTFGLEPTASEYEGPTGIVGALNVQLRAQDFRTVNVSTVTPFYLAREQDPHAIIAMLEAIDRGLGTSTSLAALHEAAAVLDQEAAEAMRESDPMRTLVQSLEEQFDWIRGSAAPIPTRAKVVELPTSDEVIADVEWLLEQQRGTGGSGSNGKATLS